MVATLQFIRPTLRQVLPRGLWAVETTCTLLPRTLTISIGSSARAKSDWASNQPLNFTPEDRKLAIQRLQSETYPRVEFGVSRSTCKEFVECYSTKILPGQTCDNEQIVVCGMLDSPLYFYSAHDFRKDEWFPNCWFSARVHRCSGESSTLAGDLQLA